MSDDSQGQRRYRVVGDNHYHDGECLRTGDVFAPTQRELNAFGFKFEPVDDADAESKSEEASADADTTADDAADLESLAYSELQDLAKEHGIKANQSTEDLIAALREAREE